MRKHVPSRRGIALPSYVAVELIDDGEQRRQQGKELPRRLVPSTGKSTGSRDQRVYLQLQ